MPRPGVEHTCRSHGGKDLPEPHKESKEEGLEAATGVEPVMEVVQS